MAIVKVVKGDLLRMFRCGAFQAIGHGCNTRNLMGAGIADQIRVQFPEAYQADTDFHDRMAAEGAKPHDNIPRIGGELSIGHTKHGQIYNLYTQIDPGRNADYQLLELAMKNLNKFCKQRSIKRVGLPLIGAGIGGLDIIAAMTIIGACTPDLDVTIVVWGSDTKSWEKASQYRNLAFPRVFEGAAIRNGNKILLQTFETDGRWVELNLDPEKARIMPFQGEAVLSLNDDSPYKFLLIDSLDGYDKNKDRIFSK